MAATALPFPSVNRHHEDIDWDEPTNARNIFSLRLANAYFTNAWFSDISIYIPMDDHTVPAHRFILAAASPVLHRCCFGTGSISGDMVITVPEFCSTEVLLIVLRYLYVGDDADGLAESNVAQVLKMADYFELNELRRLCEERIDTMISADTVCGLFSHLHYVNTKVVSKCMFYMLRKVRVILQNGSALRMELAALAKLLATRHKLSINYENVLVQPMVKWADAQCIDQGLAVTPRNRRKVLGDRVYMVCFGSMSYVEFMKVVLVFGRGFFTDNEIKLTVQQISQVAKNELDNAIQYPFLAKKRCQVYILERSYVNSCNPDSLSGTSGPFTFIIDASQMKHLKLTEIGFFDSVNKVKLKIYRTGGKVRLPCTLICNHIFFHGSGICPDENQQISLKITILKGRCFLTSTIKRDQPWIPNSPRVVATGDKCCVRSFTYTCSEFS